MKKMIMRRVVCAVLAGLMLIPLLIGTVPSASADSKLTDATVQKFEEEIAQLAAEQKVIRQNLEKLQREGASYLTYKKELDMYLDTTARKMESAQILVDELNEQIANKQAEIEATKLEYDKTFQQFLDMMVLAYEEGDASYIGLILGADSLSDFLSRLERVSSIMAYNRTLMKGLTEKEESLTAAEAKLQEQKAKQEGIILQLAADEVEYQAKLDDVLVQLEILNKDQAKAQAALYETQKQEAELDRQLEEYLIELQKKNQLQMEAGDWLWPIPLNVTQRLSSGYGWRMLWGAWDFHRGWDIACAGGTDILASKSGTVVISTYHNSYGNYIVIDHGDGVSTVYAHASKLLVAVGAKVQKGDVIAKVGTTGSSTGNHLHFEFRQNGKYTDPWNFITNPPYTVPASRYEK